MKCPNCHELLEKGDTFCSKCGTRIEKSKKVNNFIAIIGGGVLLFFLVGSITWLFLEKTDHHKYEGEEVQNTQEIGDEFSREDKIEDGEEEDMTNIENNVKDESKNDVNEVTEEYVLEQSNSQYLTESDVQGMSAQQLNYGKNEIYARHGRRFKSLELQNFFNEKSWYIGKYAPEDFDENYSDSLLSDIEKRNAEFLKEMEHRIAPSGYQLDK